MEQIILFVYDTAYCQTEADDPQKAVLFFYPNWVSEQQRLALCGQLMGAAHFCSTNFSPPRILSLQSGKFVLKKFGNFIVSLGSDKTLNDWVLEERFFCLEDMLQFYNNGISNLCTSKESDRNILLDKLNKIFSVYIPILQYAVSSFGNVPTIWFPKTSSSVFLEAIQLLETCRENEGALGGVILHHNSVLASQLDSDLTRLLALSEPGKLKSVTEGITTQYHLPVGVQIFEIYLSRRKYDQIKIAKDDRYSNSSEDNKHRTKRDVTKIFTVPEEDDSSGSVSSRQSLQQTRSRETQNKWRSRKQRELKMKMKEKNYHNITSVCVTPTVENKIIHEDLVSICAGKIENKIVPDVVKDAIKAKKDRKPVETLKIKTKIKNKISFDDLMIDTSYKSCPVPMRYYSIGLPTIGKELEPADKPKNKLYKSNFYKTIADPMHPVFRYDGVPISLSLYNHCLDEHYKNYVTANDTIDSIEELLKSRSQAKETHEQITKTINNLNETLENSEAKPKENVVVDVKMKNENNQKFQRSLSEKEEDARKSSQKVFRKSLTLPIKPMTLDDDNKDDINFSIGPSPTKCSYLKSKVLSATTPSTPLMTKLSLLALEEQNMGGSSQGVVKKPRKSNSRSQQSTITGAVAGTTTGDGDTVPCLLFVCSQQNMTLAMLIDSVQGQNPDLVLQLWETVFNNLMKLESSLGKSTDHLSSNNNHQHTNTYSFLSLDPQWGTTQRFGAWANEELKIVGTLHQNFTASSNVTEIIVRNEEAVVYGYRCGTTQTYYQQAGCSSIGLPTPADLMGVITLKARRRLERDHGVVLL